MVDGFYRIGQASKHLGVSSYHLRRLCEAGAIDAELTSGNQWRVAIAEVTRLKRDGVPPIPQRLSKEEDDEDHSADESREVPDGLYAEPSEDVIDSAEEVTITENRLRKRRLERELEQEEDFFRERATREAAGQAAEREEARKQQERRRRREWEDEWIEFALDRVPDNAPKELGLEVHSQVAEALGRLQADQPAIAVRRIVEAAVDKALAPWHRTNERVKAIEEAIRGLPYAIQRNDELEDLKLEAIRLATNAVNQCHPEAASATLQAAARNSVKPVLRVFEHAQTVNAVASWIFVRGASSQEQREADELVKTALAKLPVGSSRTQMERTRDEALAPVLARIAERERVAAAKAEQQRQRTAAEWRLNRLLDHIGDYLKEAYEYEDTYAGIGERFDDARRLKEQIRPTLLEECLADPSLDDDDVRGRIEELVDELL